MNESGNERGGFAVGSSSRDDDVDDSEDGPTLWLSDFPPFCLIVGSSPARTETYTYEERLSLTLPRGGG